MKWNKYPDTKPSKKGSYLLYIRNDDDEFDYEVAKWISDTHRKDVWSEELQGFVSIKTKPEFFFDLYECDNEVIAWTEIPEYEDGD